MAQQATRGASGLLEREDEVDLIRNRLERASAGDGRLVVIEGPAGVGKSALLRAAAELGGSAGARVLSSRGSELDRTFPFGLVRQLFARVVAADPVLTSGSGRAAAAVFASEGGDAPGEAFYAALDGLYWLVIALTAAEPLVLLVDDVHWADSESLRWLVYLAERLEDLPVLLVTAERPAEPGADAVLLDALAGVRGGSVVRPTPLSASATMDVVRDRLPEAAEDFCLACHRATGGNPFLLGELIAELLESGARGAAGEASGVLSFGSERVERAVRRRLRRLPPAATDVARAVAVLGPEALLTEVAALTQHDPVIASTAADALVATNLLASGRALDFFHPVLRSAVYDQIPPFERQALHAAAADMLAAQGASNERVARHLLRIPAAQEPRRMAILRGAARAASARGASSSSARYLRRALEESPEDTERAVMLHELGVAEATDRQRGGFDGPLRAAMALASSPQKRGEIALDLGRALAGSGDFRASARVLDDALGELDDGEGELAVALEAELLAMTFHEFTLAAPAARWEHRFAQLAAGEPLAPATTACLALAIAASRPPATSAIELCHRTMGKAALRQRNSTVAGMLGNALIYAGEASSAARFYDEMIATSIANGNRLDLGWQLLMRSDASLRLGQVRRAEAEARRGLGLMEEDPHAVAWSAATVVGALVARGALAEAEVFLDGNTGLDAPPSFPLALLLTARAELHLAAGRAGAALQDARAAGALLPAAITNPRCCRWRSPAALALWVLGRDEEARAEAERELADARAFEIPEAEGVALRTLGLVTGGEDGLAHLYASVALLEGCEGRLEHARSLLELGAAVRRAGRRTDARALLRAALDATARVGASGLGDRAHEELVAAGARPRRNRRMLSGRESLTAREDHVAVLAAEGLTNRQIAQREFVTVKAIQWHLGNVYRKLDISSREELPEALGPPPQV